MKIIRSRAAQTVELKILSNYELENAWLCGVTICEYEPGEYICMEDYPLEALLIVISGRAKVSFSAENGRILLLGFYNESGFIGDLEFMTGSDMAHMGVQAVTSVVCLSIPLASNKKELRENARFLMHVGNALAEKLSSSNEICAQIILYPLEMRLCSYIKATAEDGFFSEKLTETAELLGTSYRHLLRALTKLCERKILEKRGHSYYVFDQNALERSCMGIYG